MRILQRYIATTVISTILMVVLVLVGLEIFIAFSGEFQDMGTGNYGILQVILCVFMLLPTDVYQFFPMAGLLGSLIGLGLLASRSELVVMRAAGVSLTRITWLVIKTAILITLFAILLGEVIAPFAQHAANVFKGNAMSQGQALHTLSGTWVRKGNDFIYIGKLVTHEEMQTIRRYQFDDNHKLITASLANRAVYKDGKWIFEDIAVSKFVGNRVFSEHYAQQDWGLEFNPRLLGFIDLDNDQGSLPQLHSYIKYLHKSGLQASQYEFTFWQRIFQPLATLVMILLAVPFIFGPLRSTTMGLRILAGAVVGFCFYMLNQFIGPVTTAYQLPPLAAASLPTVVVAILGVGLLLRAK